MTKMVKSPLTGKMCKQGAARTGIPNKPGSKKPGYAPKPIDWDTVKRLAMVQCSIDEVCDVVGISENQLRARYSFEHNNENFAEFFKQHKQNGRQAIRKKQYQVAMEKGDVKMLIWLGKNWLGQSDKIEHTAAGDSKLQLAYGDPNADRSIGASEFGGTVDDSEDDQ